MKKDFNDFFVYQQDEYSCGPACISTVAKIYQVANVDYYFLRNILQPVPETGTSPIKMTNISRCFLPFESCGENCYTGNIAIANIIMGGEGHYVVFLCLDGQDVLYYDPYHHRLVADKIASVEWVSGSRDLKCWSINYKPLPENSFERWRALEQA